MAEKPIDMLILRTQNFDGKDYVDYEEFSNALYESERSWMKKFNDLEKINRELSEKCAYLKLQFEREQNKTQAAEEKTPVDLEEVIYEQQAIIGDLTTALDVILDRYVMLKQNMG